MKKAVWVAAAVLAAVLIVPVLAQQSGSATHDHQSAAPAEQHGMMMMMDQRMMAEMKTSDERIQQLVERMKTTTGEQKVAAMADLLEQLATNQTTMHRHMMGMMK